MAGKASAPWPAGMLSPFMVVLRFVAAEAQVDNVVDLVAGDQLLGFRPVPRPVELLAPEISPLFRGATRRTDIPSRF